MRRRIMLLLLVSIATAGVFTATTALSQDKEKPAKAVNFTDKTFDDSIKRGVVLVDFWAVWCGPCRIQGPIVDELSGEYKEKAVIAKLDVDANPVITRRFYIQSIPTIVIFKDGKAVERLTGLQNKQKLTAALNKHLQ